MATKALNFKMEETEIVAELLPVNIRKSWM
jgi:hypothetical protein